MPRWVLLPAGCGHGPDLWECPQERPVPSTAPEQGKGWALLASHIPGAWPREHRGVVN